MNPQTRQSEKPYVMAHKPSRARLAEQITCEAMDLPAGHNFLTGHKRARFRALYGEAYLALACQFPEDKLVIPALCGCNWKPYPHRHSEAELIRFRQAHAMREVCA